MNKYDRQVRYLYTYKHTAPSTPYLLTTLQTGMNYSPLLDTLLQKKEYRFLYDSSS